MKAHRPTVLILSNDPAFARELSRCWPADSNSPEFTVLEGNLFRDLIGSHYDLAIADAASSKAESDLKQALLSGARPAILIGGAAPVAFPRAVTHGENAMIELYRSEPRGRESGEELSWAVVAGLLGREMLRRAHAEARAREAENLCATAQAEAVLGRYMVEMRRNVNNALTSVLGNAELLEQEPGLPANAIAEADTIRNMALRLHEIFQRFSSIENELLVAARESGRKPAQTRAASSGM